MGHVCERRVEKKDQGHKEHAVSMIDAGVPDRKRVVGAGEPGTSLND